MTADQLEKFSQWAKEDQIVYKQAAKDLGVTLADAALAGRHNGYFMALKNIFENPSKFGLQVVDNQNKSNNE